MELLIVEFKNSSKFENHGKYKREELTKLMKENNIDVICLLSICPETFSYLCEAISCGIPVITTNLGALENV